MNSKEMIEEFLKNKGATQCPDYDASYYKSCETRTRSQQTRKYNQQNTIVQATRQDGSIKPTKKALDNGALETVGQVKINYKNDDLIGIVWKNRLVTRIEYAKSQKGRIVEVCVFSDGGVVKCSKVKASKH